MNDDFVTNAVWLPDEKVPEPADPKEDRLRRDVNEKKAQKELEAAYNKNKIEQDKEMEKKKKEFGATTSKKTFTFDYSGKLIYLKPSREDNYIVNEITETAINSKKAIKSTNPPEVQPRQRIAEILDREGGDRSVFGPGSKTMEDNKPSKKGKFSGMFKPAPPVIDIIQV